MFTVYFLQELFSEHYRSIHMGMDQASVSSGLLGGDFIAEWTVGGSTAGAGSRASGGQADIGERVDE
jgi:hypothetical protein